MKKKLFIAIGVAICLGIASALVIYSFVFSGNTHGLDDDYLYIRSNDQWEDVRDHLIEKNVIENMESFDLVADKMNLPNTFKPGRYKVKQGMSNVDLVRMIRSGNWEKVVIKIKPETTRDSLIQYLALSLETSSEDLMEALSSNLLYENGFTLESRWSIFLPDHYHFNWASTGEKVIRRFLDEYNNYWNEERLALAREKGLTSKEVCVLASIVDAEALHVSEMPTIAGLYLNRLKKGIALQADPTILYVVGREGRRRVLNRDLRKEDPYNTYLNKGLPPGPIFFPDKRAIEACLRPEKHNYIFMCAKPDGSFYHNFTASSIEHARNARAYRRYLNSQGIRR